MYYTTYGKKSKAIYKLSKKYFEREKQSLKQENGKLVEVNHKKEAMGQQFIQCIKNRRIEIMHFKNYIQEVENVSKRSESETCSV